MPESLLQRLRRLIERDILEVEDLLALEIASQMHSLLVGAVMVIGTISTKAHIILDTQACEEEDVVHGTFFRDVLQETGDISGSGLSFVDHGHEVIHIRDENEDRLLFHHLYRDIRLIHAGFDQRALDLVAACEFRQQLAEVGVNLLAVRDIARIVDSCLLFEISKFGGLFLDNDTVRIRL